MEACLDSENVSGSSIENLLAKLSIAKSPISPALLSEYLEESKITLNGLRDWVKFSPDVYARNRIALFPQVEVLLMCWKSGQLTPIHDHKGSACAVKIVQGIATEIAYRKTNHGSLAPYTHQRFFEGEILHSYDEDVHQMGNLEKQDADLITLHCYSPPLNNMRLFDSSSTYFTNYDALYKKATARINGLKAL